MKNETISDEIYNSIRENGNYIINACTPIKTRKNAKKLVDIGYLIVAKCEPSFVVFERNPNCI